MDARQVRRFLGLGMSGCGEFPSDDPVRIVMAGHSRSKKASLPLAIGRLPRPSCDLARGTWAFKLEPSVFHRRPRATTTEGYKTVGDLAQTAPTDVITPSSGRQPVQT